MVRQGTLCQSAEGLRRSSLAALPVLFLILFIRGLMMGDAAARNQEMSKKKRSGL